MLAQGRGGWGRDALVQYGGKVNTVPIDIEARLFGKFPFCSRLGQLARLNASVRIRPMSQTLNPHIAPVEHRP